jgi:hypothetical protein
VELLAAETAARQELGSIFGFLLMLFMGVSWSRTLY